MRIFKMPGWRLALLPLLLFGLAGCIRTMWHPSDTPSFTRPALPSFYRASAWQTRPAANVYSCTNPTQCFAGVAAFSPSQATGTGRSP